MIVDLTAVPNSPRFFLSVKDGRLKVHLKSPPENNLANLELITQLAIVTGCGSVRILSGRKLKRKKVYLESFSQEQWASFLNALKENNQHKQQL